MSDLLTLKLDIKKSKPSENKEYNVFRNIPKVVSAMLTPLPSPQQLTLYLTLPDINIQLLLIDDPDQDSLLKVLDNFDKDKKQNDTKMVSNTINNVTNTT